MAIRRCDAQARVQYRSVGFFRLSGGLIEEAWIVGDTQELCVARAGVMRDETVPG
jgi:hypothetical protein